MIGTRRYVIEFGIGMDMHGQDVNKAAQKAVRDAISKSCLIGLKEVLGIAEEDMDERVVVRATVGVSRPMEINEEEIKKCLPLGRKHVKAVSGGMTVPGLYYPRFEDKDDSIEVALACIEVSIKNE